MHEWERQIHKWATDHVTLNDVSEVDDDKASEMKQVELIDLEISCNPH